MTQQFYKLTLSSAIALYQNGLISATALVYFYIRIKLKPGWKLTLHQRPTCSELGIQKTAFYKAISRLKETGLIDWESPNGLVVSLPQNTETIPQTEETFPQNAETIPQTEETFPQNAETSGQIAELSGQNAETSGQIAENKSSKSASVKASSVPPDSYQIFIRSLSDSTREKFFNFVREKIKDFPKPINDVSAWLASKNQAGQERFRVYYNMFQSEIGEAFAPSQDWANHPRSQEWLEALRRYPKGFPYMKEWAGSLEEKKAFADWAFGNNLVWESKT